MGMSFHRLLPAFAFCALMAAAPIPPSSMAPFEHELEVDGDRYVRRRRGKGMSNRRGKGRVTPPKARPNRMHLSKRVRRKHRRAA